MNTHAASTSRRIGDRASKATRGRFGRYVIFALLAAHFAFFALVASEGHLSLDEGIYHLMSYNGAALGTLSTWNGYDELASAELTLRFLRPFHDQLFPQYPSLYAVMVSPLFALLGLKGLFLPNVVAFPIAVVLVHRIAWRLFDDRELARNSAIAFAFGTYAWPYSQAIWPHMVQISLLLGALAAILAATRAERLARAALLAALCGLLGGLATGVRLDSVFLVPALVFAVFRRSSGRLTLFVCLAAGLAPSYVFLAWTNSMKFGVWSPFSYGAAEGNVRTGGYIPLALAASIAAAFFLPAIAAQRGGRVSHWRWLLAIGGVAVFAMVPVLREMVARLLDGAYQVIVDLRTYDPSAVEPAQARGPAGGLFYFGVLKKSLLQSCPYFAALLLPLYTLLRPTEERSAHGILFTAAGGFIVVFSYFAWHGGLGFNLRYLLPATPFLCILAAWTWRELHHEHDPAWRHALAYIWFASLATAVVLIAWGVRAPVEVREAIFVAGPLALAAVLAFSAIGWILDGWRAGSRFRFAAAATFVAAFAWSVVVGFVHDSWADQRLRGENAIIGRAVERVVAPDSILFADYPDPFFRLIGKRVRFADPTLDAFKTMRPLIERNLSEGRDVYIALTPGVLAHARDAGVFGCLDLAALFVARDIAVQGATFRADLAGCRAPGG